MTTDQAGSTRRLHWVLCNNARR